MKRQKMFALVLSLLLVFALVAPAAAAQGSDSAIKNVIFMIGDGMGENHLLLAKEQGYLNKMFDFPTRNESTKAALIETRHELDHLGK